MAQCHACFKEATCTVSTALLESSYNIGHLDMKFHIRSTKFKMVVILNWHASGCFVIHICHWQIHILTVLNLFTTGFKIKLFIWHFNHANNTHEQIRKYVELIDTSV